MTLKTHRAAPRCNNDQEHEGGNMKTKKDSKMSLVELASVAGGLKLKCSPSEKDPPPTEKVKGYTPGYLQSYTTRCEGPAIGSPDPAGRQSLTIKSNYPLQ